MSEKWLVRLMDLGAAAARTGGVVVVGGKDIPACLTLEDEDRAVFLIGRQVGVLEYEATTSFSPSSSGRDE
jgi:hypothetical protein